MRIHTQLLALAVVLVVSFVAADDPGSTETTDPCGVRGDAETRIADCRTAHADEATFCLGVRSERRESGSEPQAELNLVTKVGSTALWMLSPRNAREDGAQDAPLAPVVELDLGRFLKTEETPEVRMSTRIPVSVLPRGYRRVPETDEAVPSSFWGAADPYVWAPSPSDFGLLLAAPLVVPGPCPAR